MPRRRTSIKKKVKPLTEEELEQISAVFHQYETGVRSGRIRSVVNNTLFQQSENHLLKPWHFLSKPCMPAWISWTKNALNIDSIFVHRWTRNQNTWLFFSKYFFQDIFHISFSKIASCPNQQLSRKMCGRYPKMNWSRFLLFFTSLKLGWGLGLLSQG